MSRILLDTSAYSAYTGGHPDLQVMGDAVTFVTQHKEGRRRRWSGEGG